MVPASVQLLGSGPRLAAAVFLLDKTFSIHQPSVGLSVHHHLKQGPGHGLHFPTPGPESQPESNKEKRDVIMYC